MSNKGCDKFVSPYFNRVAVSQLLVEVFTFPECRCLKALCHIEFSHHKEKMDSIATLKNFFGPFPVLGEWWCEQGPTLSKLANCYTIVFECQVKIPEALSPPSSVFKSFTQILRWWSEWKSLVLLCAVCEFLGRVLLSTIMGSFLVAVLPSVGILPSPISGDQEYAGPSPSLWWRLTQTSRLCWWISPNIEVDTQHSLCIVRAECMVFTFGRKTFPSCILIIFKLIFWNNLWDFTF